MIQILCVCGNGMGTSTIMKINLKNICSQYKIDAEIESCAFSESMAYLANTDLIVTSPEWSAMIPETNAIRVEVLNLIDVENVTKALLEAVNQYFPEAINK